MRSKADTPIEEFTPTPAFPALQYLESVDEGGVAWEAGLRTGDFLIEVRHISKLSFLKRWTIFQLIQLIIISRKLQCTLIRSPYISNHMLLYYSTWCTVIVCPAGPSGMNGLAEPSICSYLLLACWLLSTILELKTTTPPVAIRRNACAWGWFLSSWDCRFMQFITDCHVKSLHIVKCPVDLVCPVAYRRCSASKQQRHELSFEVVLNELVTFNYPTNTNTAFGYAKK